MSPFMPSCSAVSQSLRITVDLGVNQSPCNNAFRIHSFSPTFSSVLTLHLYLLSYLCPHITFCLEETHLFSLGGKSKVTLWDELLISKLWKWQIVMTCIFLNTALANLLICLLEKITVVHTFNRCATAMSKVSQWRRFDVFCLLLLLMAQMLKCAPFGEYRDQCGFQSNQKKMGIHHYVFINDDFVKLLTKYNFWKTHSGICLWCL